mgnify:CR=1 FL=1
MKRINYNTNLPEEVISVPGMISENERKFLFKYALELYTGKGKIVDLGCWLGATTIALADGLQKMGNIFGSKKLIYAYELFKWDETYNKHLSNIKYGKSFSAGDDFLAEYENNIKAYRDFIEIRKDIINSGWEGEKIEFLLVDAMKTQEVTRKILSNFYPFLIPGTSLVYHQDFDHFLTPWVHVLIYLHRDFFTFFHDVPGTGGIVFKMGKRITSEVLNIDFMDLDEDTVEKAFNYNLSLASKTKKQGVAAAHVMYYVMQKKYDRAFYKWTDYLWSGFELNSDFLEVKALLDKERTSL